MADSRPDRNLGELILPDDAICRAVQYADTIIPGDILMVSNVNTDGQEIVSKHDGTTPPRYVAIYAGVSGDFRDAIYKGTTKVTFGGIVGSGVNLTAAASATKFTAQTGTALKSGYAMDASAADGDAGYIYFNGDAS